LAQTKNDLIQIILKKIDMTTELDKLTEDETVNRLMKYLKSINYEIISFCHGHQRGIDIIASRNGQRLLVEVKGAKANHNSLIKKRAFFDSGQIKDHFGKAIVKAMEMKTDYPDDIVAIAHPADKRIEKNLSKSIPHLEKLGVKHFWVSADGRVQEGYQKNIIIESKKIDTNSQLNKSNNLEISSKSRKLNPTNYLNYFIVSEAMYNKNHIIQVDFNRGPHDGTTYVYNHDELYDRTLDHLLTLKCWKDYEQYTSNTNIPRWALNTELVKEIV